MSHFSETCTIKNKIELDLFHYATKSDLKDATGADTSQFDHNNNNLIIIII